MTDADSPGEAVYDALLQEELDAQEKRKASLEQRGLAVVTTSGTLVTLLFALAALSTKKAATFEIPSAARDWLIAALIPFVLSALCALLTKSAASL